MDTKTNETKKAPLNVCDETGRLLSEIEGSLNMPVSSKVYDYVDAFFDF